MSSTTRLMESHEMGALPPQGRPYAPNPEYHRRPGPGPAHSNIPRRYEPYRSTYPHRLPRPPSLDMPRLPPISHSTPSPSDIRIGPKNHDPLRPEGLYQASKGAKRDIKWMQKHPDKSGHSPIRHPSQPDIPLPPYVPRSTGHEPDRSLRGILGNHEYRPHSNPRGGIQRISSISPLDRGQAVPFPKRARGMLPQEDQDIKEQQRVIAAARAEYIRERQVQKKEEWERKVKRIQMQVFVHARPTPCPWGSCPALLNSWALLEKHLLHCHLHPQSKGMPAPGRPVQCKFKTCDQLFGTGGECYQHCLSTHMGKFGARCPFNCAYEGPSFDELMAHIGRRHRKATPDDFVPGLIHHFPPNLPPVSALPKLPDLTPATIPKTNGIAPSPTIVNDSVQPCEDPSPKTTALVQRKCFSQRKPLPARYVQTRGAQAAIGAFIENIQRERLSTRAVPTSNLRQSSPDNQEADGTDPIRGSAQQGLYHSPIGNPLLDLIDVEAERRRAEKEARAMMKKLVNSGEAMSDRPKVHRFWTRTHSGESDGSSTDLGDERNDTWYTTRRQSRILSSVKQKTLEVSDDSESATEGGSEIGEYELRLCAAEKVRWAPTAYGNQDETV